MCWDLEKPEDVKELEIRVDQEEPYVLMGSPPCDPFSRLQAILRRSRDPDAYEKMREKGKHHLKTATDFYWRQLRAGRFFLHEHPAGADSWKEDCIVNLQNEPGVYTVEGPMCCYDMKLEAAAPVKLPRDSEVNKVNQLKMHFEKKATGGKVGDEFHVLKHPAAPVLALSLESEDIEHAFGHLAWPEGAPRAVQ